MAFNLTANINTRLANDPARTIRAQLKGLTIPIDIDLTPDAKKKAQGLSTSIKGLSASLKDLSLNAKSASSAIDILTRSMGNFQGGAAKLNQTAVAAKKLRTETKGATDQVAEFGKVAGLSLRRNAGFVLATAAIYGLGRAITSSFTEAIRFQKELIKVAQVSNRSVSSLKPLTDEITRLATSLGVASSDLIDISLILAQAGLSANETKQALEALAKTTLAATFGDIQDTTEGAIALMSQFGIAAKDLGKALGSTNAVSAAFAVESEDIISAVKRAGGVFAQTSKGLKQGPLETFNQFIAVFSAVRATTRESAESIATGIRTIFTRVQRPATIQYLKELGISLTDAEGKFVGPYEAVTRLSKGLEGLDRRGSTFARVSEELGGFRQIGKTLALLSSSTQRIQAYNVALQGQNSVNKDAEQAQQSLANAILKTQENFAALIRDIAQTKTFDTIVRSVLSLANAFIKLADAAKLIIPVLSTLALVKGVSIGSGFVNSFRKSLTGAKGYAVGGRVTGGKGGVDDIPAMLTAGEYVINKKSAFAIGKENLDELNKVGKGGRVGFANGGSVGNVNDNRVRMVDGGDPEEELKRLRELDERLGKNQGARKERARLFESIRKKTLRNQTNDPKLAGLFGGGITPAFEANVGGRNVAANTGQNLVGELSESKQQDRLEEINKKRIQRNKNHNTEQARLQAKELAAQRELAELAQMEVSERERTYDLSRQNFIGGVAKKKGPILSSLQYQLNSFSGVSGLGSVPGQQVVDPDLAALKQQQEFNQLSKRKKVNVTGQRTISVRDYMRVLNEPVGRAPMSDYQPMSPADLFGTSQNVTSTYKPGRTGRTDNFRSRLLKGAQKLKIPGFSGENTNLLGLSSRGGNVSSSFNKLGKNLTRVGGAGVVGGILLGDKVGGPIGGALTGAAGGAGAGALVGGAPGAVIGGIVGAFNGFVTARLDEKIKKSSDSIIASVEKVEEGFANFNPDSLSLAELNKKLPQLNANFSGTTNKIRKRGELGLEQGVNSFSGRSQTLFDAIKGIPSFSFRQSGQASIDRQNKESRTTTFNDLQSELAKSSEKARSLLDAQINKGVGFDDAIGNLGGEAKVALAVGNAKGIRANEIGRAIQSGDNSKIQKAADNFLQSSSFKPLILEQIEANKKFKEGQAELAALNKETDLFVDRLGNLSAVIDRASLSSEGFKRQNESILSRRSGGAGIVSQEGINVFDNPKAFTTREIAGQARNLNAFLGNNANSKEFTNSIIGSKQVETGLPRVLNELSSRVSVQGKGEARTALPEVIEKNFGSLPEVLRKKLESDINQQFFANEQASPDDISQALSGGDSNKISQEITNDIYGVAKKLTDAINKTVVEYEAVLDTFIQINEEANRAQDNRLQILNESNNQEIKLLGQRRLTLAERGAGFKTQLGQFTGRAGTGTSVAEIIAGESRSNSLRGSVTGAPDERARQFAILSQQQNDSLKALELIVNNTERQNALQEDLNSLIDSRKEARQIFEDFTFGSPTQKREIERNIDLARRQTEGEDLFGRQLEGARQGQRALSALVGSTQGPDAAQQLDQKFINILDRNGADRLFDAAGVNPGVGVGGLLNNRDQLFQGQFQQLQELNRERGAAAAGIEGINRRDANSVLDNGQKAYDSFQSNISAAMAKGGLLDMLNATLSSVPEVIQIGGTVTHTFNFNGLETFVALEPSIKKLVSDHVNSEINRRMNPLTGESNPA